MMLAAGRGTRLGELGRRLPKALVEVGGRPLLERQLDYLAAEGVQHVVVNAHHLAEQIVEHVARRDRATEVEVVVEPELLGTAGGVRNALSRFDLHAPIIVAYADTILDAPLRAIVAGHERAGADGTICANWLENTHGKGVIDADGDGNVLAFREKPADPKPGLASTGLYVLERELIELIPEGRFCDFGLDVFPDALAAGRRLRVHRLDAVARDIGTLDSLAQAQDAPRLGAR
jgi:NDP-sugar pyrophosphorylase family protein